ncbi:hypothetical protein C8Q80DRAFT_1269421 [Daedaleopsis nitida]|nr:hypothetical protein C8Q80DRAFT_1269421 [Daedaleopsis nitida]
MSPTVALCLACASSLPPRKAAVDIFYTKCCIRPICPNCISKNPRLARYNPCLRCLAGVNAVSAQSTWVLSNVDKNIASAPVNIDGAVRDEDIFLLEDEDDSDLETEEDGLGGVPSSGDEPVPNAGPSYHSDGQSLHGSTLQSASRSPSPKVEEQPPGMPSKYFIRSEDTLLGISLKLRVDGRILCRLNNLPISTLRTTPHLLHTRAFLLLPPSARPAPPLTAAEQTLDEERRARFATERAETRFQSMTKETDRDVAKAYVALAGLPDGADIKEYDKEKDNGLRKRHARTSADGDGEGNIEGRAMDQYFDDGDWEEREREEGRKATISPFPYFSQPAGSSRAAEKASAASLGGQKSWWRWGS